MDNSGLTLNGVTTLVVTNMTTLTVVTIMAVTTLDVPTRSMTILDGTTIFMVVLEVICIGYH